MNFLLDPYIIAVPDSETANTLSNYAEALFQWSDMVRTKRHTFWLSSFVAMALTNNNQYPHFSTLKRYSKYEKVIQAYDLFRAIEKDFMHPDYLDEHLENGHCIYDAENSVVLPIEIEERLHPDVSKALKETLALMAIAENLHDSDLAKQLIVATNPLPAPASQVDVNLDIIQNDGDEMQEINSSWRLISDPQQLDEIEGLLKFWPDTLRALNWAFKQLQACGSLKKGIICPSPVVGLEFNKSIIAINPSKNPGVLDAIFRNTIMALLEIPGFERHKFARSDDGKINKHHRLLHRITKQHITRKDGATAWRVHLCGNHRLHYWLLHDGSAELSLVTDVQHNNYHIV